MDGEVLSRRALNRATLVRQGLSTRAQVPVVDAVRAVVALQAQEPAAPYLALWNRVADLDAAAVDEAFESGRLLKCSLLRITLHAVAAEDHPTFHAAMSPALRASRLNDRRFAEAGTSLEEVDALVPHLRERLVEPHTRDEVEVVIAELLARDPHERVWWALRTYAPLVHAATPEEPWRFGRRPSYRAAPPAEAPDHVAAVAALVRRYLAAFGPATTADVTQFTMLPLRMLRPALDRLADALVVRTGEQGAALLDVPDGALPDEDAPAPPRLLGMWDNVLLAYRDRRRIIPDELREHVIRRNGDVLPTLLVDGRVAGVWRATATGTIEGRALTTVDEQDWDGLATEAAALQALLADRDPEVFGRHRRWWDRLPDGETRTLAG